MIAKIIYGQTCTGTLNYVLGKEGMQVLGYGNTFSQSISPKFFRSVLYFQGQRNATKNRYAHISLNLPHGEHLDDRTFYKISKEYMENMGFGNQPYVVVRHHDTKHEHVHIVTTTVKEDGKVLEISIAIKGVRRYGNTSKKSTDLHLRQLRNSKASCQYTDCPKNSLGWKRKMERSTIYRMS
ncbi:relaxase/mobilization nuclease domain-containing protein [Euzebyella saccharophila]|uniref:Relaxase/mobilization nuclease domain-containing protein n=1 Tax=Euzebyella saccharophila TaxID=679664 RepID=A0ABV8JLF8_9FLAO|nr:relaxase/mobilization nuclease domain-containing protein [Euzebyella saccharophila]